MCGRLVAPPPGGRPSCGARAGLSAGAAAGSGAQRAALGWWAPRRRGGRTEGGLPPARPCSCLHTTRARAHKGCAPKAGGAYRCCTARAWAHQPLSKGRQGAPPGHGHTYKIAPPGRRHTWSSQESNGGTIHMGEWALNTPLHDQGHQPWGGGHWTHPCMTTGAHAATLGACAKWGPAASCRWEHLRETA